MNNRCASANLSSRHRMVAGFTLLEIMIVVLIIAIIAAIAIPNYSRYAFQARRADGQATIMRIANAQERFYTANNRYAALPALGFAAAVVSQKQDYKVTSVLAAGNQSYTLTAAPQNGQLNDKCGSLTYTSTGAKAFTGNENNGKCW